MNDLKGIYTMNYVGTAGAGFGMIVFRDGIVAGADVVGGTYDGSYGWQDHSASIEGMVNMTVPAGASLVTGAPASSQPYQVDIPFAVAQANLGAEFPATVRLPTGPVSVVFKKLRDLPN